MSRSLLKQYIRQIIIESSNPRVVPGPGGIQRIEKTYTSFDQEEFDWIVKYLTDKYGGEEGGIELEGPYKFKGEVESVEDYEMLDRLVTQKGGEIERTPPLKFRTWAPTWEVQGQRIRRDSGV